MEEEQGLQKAQSKRRRRRLSSCLPSCFLGSPVSDSDVPERPPPRSAGRSRREKKEKKAAAVDAPTKAAAEEPDKSSAEVVKAQQQHPLGLQQQSNVDSTCAQQSSLPHISPKYTARLRPTPPPESSSHRAQAQIESTVIGTSIVNSSSSCSADSIGGTGKLGPIFGAGIMLATLVILLFADRATAVLCLCSCLYVLRLAGASSSSPANCDDVKIGSKVVDLDSNEYKKRVILEGLLERNGRRPSLHIAATGTA